MGKGRLLSIEEVSELLPSGKEYYVEKNSGCVKNSGIYKLEVLPYFKNNDGGAGSYFGRSCQCVRSGDYKVYEYEEEEGVMKEYKNSEVLVMLEKNANLKFKCGQEGHVYTLSTFGDKIFVENEKGSNCGFCLNDRWSLVEPKQVEVTFMEAAKAYLEGKAIHCKDDEEIINTYHKPEHGIGMKDTDGYALTAEEIVNNKWYIED